MNEKIPTIQEILERNTGEEGLNLDGFTKDLNTNYVDYVSNKNVTAAKENFKTEFETEYFKNLGIDNVTNYDQFKVYTKQITGNTDEVKENYLKLQSDYNTLQEQTKTYEQQFNNANSKLLGYEMASKLGIDDLDYATFLGQKWTSELQEGETLDDKINSFREQNRQPRTTGVRNQTTSNTNTIPEWQRLVYEKNKIKY